MSEPFIGQIQTFGFNFPPRGWAHCDGQSLAISSYSALFSLLGTTYGGDGRTTFGLPDLRGRFPTHYGNGPGLTPRSWGQKGGAETHTLIQNEIPQHKHGMPVTATEGNQTSPVGGVPATANDGESNYSSNTTGLLSNNTENTGGGLPHNNMPPFLVINFSIALTGIFPSRS